jgi:hypothetical protein
MIIASVSESQIQMQLTKSKEAREDVGKHEVIASWIQREEWESERDAQEMEDEGDSYHHQHRAGKMSCKLKFFLSFKVDS